MGVSTAKAVGSILSERGALNENGGEYTFFVSDKAAQFQKNVSILFGKSIDESSVKTAVIDTI